VLRLSYIEADSFLHRLDPTNKFLWLIGTAFLSYVVTNPVHQTVVLLLTVLTALVLGRLPLKEFFWGMTLFVTFGVILFIMQVLFYVGADQAVLFTVGPVHIRTAGFIFGLNLAIRVFVLGASALSFIMTTEPRRMIYDMVVRLRFPYRFAFVFYAALRFIPIFENEANNILNAQAVRGSAEVEKGLLGKIKVYKRLGVPLITSGLKKAKLSAIAMDARAFGAYPTRTMTYTYDTPRVGYLFGATPWVAFVAYLSWLLATGGWHIS
jgi:energy-coupling factor transport system permease protein